MNEITVLFVAFTTSNLSLCKWKREMRTCEARVVLDLLIICINVLLLWISFPTLWIATERRKYLNNPLPFSSDTWMGFWRIFTFYHARFTDGKARDFLQYPITKKKPSKANTKISATSSFISRILIRNINGIFFLCLSEVRGISRQRKRH